MRSNRTATPLLVGILICVPMLALHHFGVFAEAAGWLGERLPRFLVLPDGGVQISKPLHYGYYTLMAFSTAWLCQELPHAWQKYLYLLAVSFLTMLLTPLLALNGILFEPFSGALAACFAGLLSMMFSDASEVTAAPETPASPPATS
jgi:hypothetical protein